MGAGVYEPSFGQFVARALAIGFFTLILFAFAAGFVIGRVWGPF